METQSGDISRYTLSGGGDIQNLYETDVTNLAIATQPEDDLETARDSYDEREAIEKLDEYVKNHIESDEKEAYMEALEKVPQTVMNESDPIWYLRFENFVVEAAARRLTLYWKRRKCLFGGRFLLPVLSLTGEGALSKDDIKALSTGVLMKLPEDPKGRTVFFSDRDESEEDANSEHRFRGVFHWLTLACLNPKSQSDGFVVIKISRKCYIENADKIAMAKIQSLIREALPLRISDYHLCCVPPPGAMHSAVTMVLSVFNEVIKPFSKKMFVHVTESEEDMCAKLVLAGFQREGLPQTLGGSWASSNFSAWLKRRMEQTETNPPKAKRTKKPQPEGPLGKLVEAADHVQIEERKSRKRHMDAIYARKRRKREKDEEDELKIKCVELSKENMRLEQDNTRLEELLRQAKYKVLLNGRGGDAPISSVAPVSNSSGSSGAVGSPTGVSSLLQGMAHPQLTQASSLQERRAAVERQSGPTDLSSLLSLLQSRRDLVEPEPVHVHSSASSIAMNQRRSDMATPGFQPLSTTVSTGAAEGYSAQISEIDKQLKDALRRELQLREQLVSILGQRGVGPQSGAQLPTMQSVQQHLAALMTENTASISSGAGATLIAGRTTTPPSYGTHRVATSSSNSANFPASLPGSLQYHQMPQQPNNVSTNEQLLQQLFAINKSTQESRIPEVQPQQQQDARVTQLFSNAGSWLRFLTGMRDDSNSNQ